MPRRRKGGSPARPQSFSIASRVRAGKAVPLISNSISNDLVLGRHSQLNDHYWEFSEYPFNQEHDLPRMLQFKSVADEQLAEAWDLEAHYLDFLKNELFDIAEAEGSLQDILAEVEAEFDELTFSEFCRRLGYPRFDQKNSLLDLAYLPLPIYLTTGYHNFIEIALQAAGKVPRSDICRWHQGLDSIPSIFAGDYEPTPEEPLVYHLHGLDQYPESLVLTEGNYLEFLVAISEHRGKEEDRIAGRVRQAMAESTLMLLGYSLRGWDFRALFWGLIQQRPRQPKSVSVQLRPDDDEEKYLAQFLNKAHFEVYWGDVNDYIAELMADLER